MKHTFVREGTEDRPRYFIVTEWPMNDEPTMITIRRVAHRSEGPVHELAPSCEVEYSIGHQCYRTSVRGAGVYIFASDDNAERTTAPIPPPKTKLPTRYRDGRWEKQSKRGAVGMQRTALRIRQGRTRVGDYAIDERCGISRGPMAARGMQ